MSVYMLLRRRGGKSEKAEIDAGTGRRHGAPIACDRPASMAKPKIGEAMYFSVGKNTAGEPSWWLYGDNAKQVAGAGETFDNPHNAQRAALAFKAGAIAARFEVYLDAGGHYRWRAWRGSDKVAASGEAFASQSNAQLAADNVQQNAGLASGL